MKLSILICSLESRKPMMDELYLSLSGQLDYIPLWDYYSIGKTQIQKYQFKEVEIIIAIDNKNISVGAKRNLLLKQAQGYYVAFVDDDDRVSDDYIKYLLRGIESVKDIINFQVMYNPKHGKQKIVLYNINYNDSEQLHCFYRTSNHLMCIKRDIALKIGFKDISFAEDSDYAKRLKRSGTYTQAEIKKVLYYYDFDHAKSETQ